MGADTKRFYTYDGWSSMKISFYDVEVEISDWSHKLKIATIIFATTVVFAVFQIKKRISVSSEYIMFSKQTYPLV